jgi:hypothetical protein
MHQQINLFQPIFREQRRLFDAKAVAWSLGVIGLALISFWTFGTFKVNQLEAEVAHLREQQRVQEQMASTAGSLRSARANPEQIRARVSRLTEDLATRTRALDLLQGGLAGNTSGFAAKLEALASQHVNGLWINRVDLGSAAGSMGLSGGTLDPDLVPRYLKALASEPALKGTRFDDFSIERSKDAALNAGVQFRAGSALLEPRDYEDRS